MKIAFFSKPLISAFDWVRVFAIIHVNYNILPPMFLSLCPANRQEHGYDLRISNCYRPYNCRTNLKQFPILYQGRKIWNSLSISITGLTSFFTFKRNMIDFWMKWVRIGQAAHPHPHPQLNCKHIDIRGGHPCMPGGFLEVSSPFHTVKPISQVANK